ncbi:hypothetical protein HD554DRAFT_2322505 [Boletus coccyginus]|nr:hypothetical protein HD554DRAFT_2322505 [Boletus coccyginus]
MSPAGRFPVHPYRPRLFVCGFPDCHKHCRSQGGLKRHARSHRPHHREQTNRLTNATGPWVGDDSERNPNDAATDADPPHRHIQFHPVLDGTPCDPFGHDLPLNTLPFPLDYCAKGDWTPYASHAHFELAEFLYRKVQMSAGKIDTLMDILSMVYNGHEPPFGSHDALYRSIDAIPYGDCLWQSFSVRYLGPFPEDPPSWMLADYDVWYRNPLRILEQQIGNPEFANGIDYAAKVVTDENGRREVCDLMSGQWAWDQSELIAQDPDTHSATFAPIVLGSDKTTVSVGTGNTEYYPLYISLGNVHNNIRRSHGGAVSILAFLAIPKTHKDDADFRHFRRQLFHSSLAAILDPVKQAMIKPQVTRCSDGHFRRIIYGLGPYIADYPEQAMLACIVQGWCARCTAQNSDLDRDGGPRAHIHTAQLRATMDLRALWDNYGIVGDVEPFTAHFPRADIHELIAPDLLHQLIKGTFKDHLVSWVNEYLERTYPKQQAAEMIAEIDRRLAAVPPFPGLCRFPEGRGFKQWTGDDSKALMKVYLPAITGLVPDPMVHAIAAFLEFGYTVRKSVINESDLDAIDNAVQCFHHERKIFKEVGVREHFSLPRQHSMVHYRTLIEMFGVPNGLCSSITESRHIKAVKEPWRRSNRFEALGQMLVTNQRLDKLAAARLVFTQKGMLDGPPVLQGIVHNVATVDRRDEEEDEAQAIEGDKSVYDHVAAHYGFPELMDCTRHFLYNQLNPDVEMPGDQIDLRDCPMFNGDIKVFNSASATYHAPSDHSGQGGMHRDIIRCTPQWRGGAARYDCVFVDGGGSEDDPLGGLLVARVLLFFSFMYQGDSYSCALVEWFLPISDDPDGPTGMWIVVPEVNAARQREHLPVRFHFSESLTAFNAYYVNKYIDHHSYTIC